MSLDPEPASAIAAAAHSNPYPYYARLVRESPFFFDPEISAWIAADARHVNAIFAHSDALVVAPDALAPELRDDLARFNDGAKHAALRSHITALLAAVSDQDATNPPFPDGDQSLDDFVRTFPVYAVANALGISLGRIPQILEKLAAGWVSAAHFSADFGIEPAVAGLLFQTYDATRGLIGNTLLALLRAEGSVHRDTIDRGLRAVIDKTVREDSPVQNTRRVMSGAARIGETEVQSGDCILLLIGAANRDPAASQVFTFGVGAHACPGQRLATAIAEAALRIIFQHDMQRAADPDTIHYLASPNARIPLFNTTRQGDASQW